MMVRPKDPLCQSCGIPLQNDEDLGTNSDGSKNKEYCYFCYQNGKFRDPDITMEQMIEKVGRALAKKRNLSEEEGVEIAVGFIPWLNRWKIKVNNKL